MTKRLKYLLIGLIIVLLVSLIITMFMNDEKEYYRARYTGEGDLWTLEMRFNGYDEFYKDSQGQLVYESDFKQDIHLIYKGESVDLSDFTKVGIEYEGKKISIASDAGLSQGELRFKGSGSPGITTLKNLQDFYVRVFWQDDEYHEEVIRVKAQ